MQKSQATFNVIIPPYWIVQYTVAKSGHNAIESVLVDVATMFSKMGMDHVGYLLAVPAEDSKDWKTTMVRLKTKSGADRKRHDRQLKDIGLYCTGLNSTGSEMIDNTHNCNEVPMGMDWDSTQDTEEQEEEEARELVTQEEAWEQNEKNEDFNELLVAPQGTYAKFCAQPSSTYQRMTSRTYQRRKRARADT